MIDPRENILHDPREELKEKLNDCGYPYETVEKFSMTMVTFNLPDDKKMSISIKQASRQPIANIKGLIDAAMNQDAIKAGLPKPTAERESDIE